jgi:hypothetical protein
VGIHDVIRTDSVIRSDYLKNLAPRKNLMWVANKQLKQIEFATRQIDGHVANQKLSIFRMDRWFSIALGLILGLLARRGHIKNMKAWYRRKRNK